MLIYVVTMKARDSHVNMKGVVRHLLPRYGTKKVEYLKNILEWTYHIQGGKDLLQK
jgi:hypothetical protein